MKPQGGGHVSADACSTPQAWQAGFAVLLPCRHISMASTLHIQTQHEMSKPHHRSGKCASKHYSRLSKEISLDSRQEARLAQRQPIGISVSLFMSDFYFCNFKYHNSVCLLASHVVVAECFC